MNANHKGDIIRGSGGGRSAAEGGGPRIRAPGEGGEGDTGLEEVREKLLVHLREAADRMKLAVPSLPNGGSPENLEPHSELEQEPSSSAAVRPWNLRMRRARSRARMGIVFVSPPVRAAVALIPLLLILDTSPPPSPLPSVASFRRSLSVSAHLKPAKPPPPKRSAAAKAPMAEKLVRTALFVPPSVPREENTFNLCYMKNTFKQSSSWGTNCGPGRQTTATGTEGWRASTTPSTCGWERRRLLTSTWETSRLLAKTPYSSASMPTSTASGKDSG